MLLLIQNSRKCKLMCSDRKQVGGGWGHGGARRDYRWARGTFRVVDVLTVLIVMVVSRVYTCHNLRNCIL